MCFAPDIIFMAPKGVASHFCGSASWSSASPQLCSPRELGAPKGDHAWAKNPGKNRGQHQGNACAADAKNKRLPNPPLLRLWPVFIPLRTFHLLHKLWLIGGGGQRQHVTGSRERQMFQMHKCSAKPAFAPYLQTGSSWQRWICRGS